MRYHTELDDTMKDAAALLAQRKSDRAKPFGDQLPKVRRKLTRKQRKAAQKIAEVEQRAKYLPYVPRHEQVAVEKARNVLEAGVAKPPKPEETKAARSKARKRWGRDLGFNLAFGIAAIVVFWWIGSTG